MGKEKTTRIAVISDDLFKDGRLATEIEKLQQRTSVITVNATRVIDRLNFYRKAEAGEIDLVIVRSESAASVIDQIRIIDPKLETWYIGHIEQIAADKIFAYQAGETYSQVITEMKAFLNSRDKQNG